MTKFDREELRLLVRQALREALGSGAPAAAPSAAIAPPPSRAGGVSDAIRQAAASGKGDVGVAVRSADDLGRFARDVIEAAADPAVKAAILAGRVAFVPAGPAAAAPRPAAAAAAGGAYEMATGVLGETRLIEIAKSHTRIALGAEVVLTPLARDKAREMKIELTRQKP